MSIPLVDFGPYLTASGAPSAAAMVVKETLRALSGPGFLYVKADFFEKPLDYKTRFNYSPVTNGGYIGLSREKLNPNLSHNDSKEAFNINPRAFPTTSQAPLTDFPLELGGSVRHNASTAPSEDSTKDRVALVSNFCREVHGFLMKLLEVLSLALEIPKENGNGTYLSSRHASDRPSGTTIRLLCYPQMRGGDKADPTQQAPRAGAHTDYGSLTALFLRPGDVGSNLEVLAPGCEDGKETWIRAPPIEGAVIINAGDLLEYWTRGAVRSTVHRVVNSVEKAGPGAKPRLSIAYFLHPEDTTPLDPIPYGPEGHRLVELRRNSYKDGRAREGDGVEYAGSGIGWNHQSTITAREHLDERLRRSYL
ncbi:hypothetical protein HDU96_001936 [Phlyctochytrium bullatum]|nr:hypothetical protein HDU96_001936 [Phlyctochytrium bullatum]